MRYITVTLGCDWPGCDTVAPENEGIVIERTIDGRTFTICKTHNEALDETLVPLMKASIKSTPKSGKRSVLAAVATNGNTVNHDTLVPCRVADCGATPKGNVGLAQHLKKSHDGMTIAQHNQLPEVT